MIMTDYTPLTAIACLLFTLAVSFAFSARIEQLRDQLRRYREFLDFVENAQVGSGVCCCGAEMVRHSYYDGHNPCDMWDYNIARWAEELKEFYPEQPR